MDRAAACALLALAIACVGRSVVPVRESAHEPEPVDDVERAIEPGADPSDATPSALTHHVVVDREHARHVRSPSSGRVVEVDVAIGDRVTAGETLFRIAPADPFGAATLARATADDLAVKHEAERLTLLYRLNERTQRDYDDLVTRGRNADAALQRARACASTDTCDAPGRKVLEVRTPIDGEVIACDVRPGVRVRGSDGDPASPLLAIAPLVEVEGPTASVLDSDPPWRSP
jgi:HlyD family secretion protein